MNYGEGKSGSSSESHMSIVIILMTSRSPSWFWYNSPNCAGTISSRSLESAIFMLKIVMYIFRYVNKIPEVFFFTPKKKTGILKRNKCINFTIIGGWHRFQLPPDIIFKLGQIKILLFGCSTTVGSVLNNAFLHQIRTLLDGVYHLILRSFLPLKIRNYICFFMWIILQVNYKILYLLMEMNQTYEIGQKKKDAKKKISYFLSLSL